MKITIENPRALNLSALGKSGNDVSASLLEWECENSDVNLSPLSLEHLLQVIFLLSSQTLARIFRGNELLSR